MNSLLATEGRLATTLRIVLAIQCVLMRSVREEAAFFADCKIGRYCTEQYKCKAGCGLDSDCFPGQRCEENTCIEYNCRDTGLDCRVGEFCGEDGCQSDNFPHCMTC